MKFRNERLQFKVSETADIEVLKHSYHMKYPEMVKVSKRLSYTFDDDFVFFLESRKLSADRTSRVICRIADYCYARREWNGKDHIYSNVSRFIRS